MNDPTVSFVSATFFGFALRLAVHLGLSNRPEDFKAQFSLLVVLVLVLCLHLLLFVVLSTIRLLIVFVRFRFALLLIDG
jgi:hypothetical protein